MRATAARQMFCKRPPKSPPNHAVIQSKIPLSPSVRDYKMEYIQNSYDTFGYMNKKGRLVKNWKRRFFVIKGQNFSYSADENSLDEPLGGGCCQELSKWEDKKHGLIVTCESGRKYYFICENEEDYLRWTEAFAQAIVRGLKCSKYRQSMAASDRMIMQMGNVERTAAPTALSDLAAELGSDEKDGDNDSSFDNYRFPNPPVMEQFCQAHGLAGEGLSLAESCRLSARGL